MTKPSGRGPDTAALDTSKTSGKTSGKISGKTSGETLGGAPPPQPVHLVEHPLRHQLAEEVHSRPYELFEAPVRASHIALHGGEGGLEAEIAVLAALLDRFGIAAPPADATHWAGTLGDVRVRWERHTEFSTYTFYRFDPLPDDPFAATALDLVPADWLATLPGKLLVGLHAAIRPGMCTPDFPTVFSGGLVVGAGIGGGAGAAWSDFRIQADGFGRILINAGTMTRGQTGRNLQRLFEMETYRMMALLAFPIARDMAPRLSRLEAETARVTSRMAEPDADGEDRDLLGELTQIAAEVEGLMAAHGYRFGAARAYHAIVQRSLRELREEPLPGTQTFTKFLDRRFSPAMRTCDAMAKRADALGRRVSRTANLLRTRVDVTLEENNRDLLRSMNRRAKLQLRLQETVEGLSVVAISYYGWGLLSYMLKGVKAAGVPFDTELASLVAVPMVVAVVFFALRRLRKLAGTHG